MKSDTQIYEIFVTVPQFLFTLIGLEIPCEYTVRSTELKELKRSVDAHFVPQDPTQPNYIFEFQAQADGRIYPRIFATTSRASLENKGVLFNGIIIFKKESVDRWEAPWATLARVNGGGFQVFYLDKLLQELKKRYPDHPLLALFAPFLEEDQEAFAKKGKDYYDQISHSKELTPSQIENLQRVFLDWALSRLESTNIDEVKAMLDLTTPVEETVAGKQLIAIGLKRGKIVGEIEGEIKSIQRFIARGLLSQEEGQKEIEPLLKKLEQLENTRNE